MSAIAPGATSSPDVSTIAHSVLSGLVHGVWQAVTQSPVIGALLAAVVIAALVRGTRRAMYSGWQRDEPRLFSPSDKRVILARAGNRCEHHFLLFGRCKITDGLQADHIHPWSRGGHTVVSNGQALCRRHNQEKRARVPFDRQLRAIERRRTGYFPAGEAPTVTRRRTPSDVSISQRAA